MKSIANRLISAIGVFFLLIVVSCNSNTPIPKEKMSYVGTWRSDSGIVITIMENGTASLKQNISHEILDFKNLGIAAGPNFINDLQVKFKDDKNLSIVKPHYYGKAYSVGIQPYMENGQYKMLLNGMPLIKDK